eukprot:comp19189_c0_seq1/m.35825 comp19189_c0_seq1/g.35825  ORF comp19189_c0_seq1/g.35825 comp19189_c0_seq1/m.35825 type:complete len:406 (+) comp19189_c0_seq1:1-1218(+)
MGSIEALSRQFDHYTWTQTDDSLSISFGIPKGTKKSDIEVKINGRKISAGLKNCPPIICGYAWGEISDSIWQIESQTFTLNIDKEASEFWNLVICGDKAFQVSKENVTVKHTKNNPFADSSSIDAHSLFLLALLSGETGFWFSRDVQLLMLEQSATMGHANAQFTMGEIYNKGTNSGFPIEESAEKALQWFEKAAAQGQPFAAYLTAVAYHNGNGVAKNIAHAVVNYEIAARGDVAPANFALGLLYHVGADGIAKDGPRAVQFYEKAAVAGIPNAVFNLGVIYLEGDGATIQPDIRIARKFFDAAQRIDAAAYPIPPALLAAEAAVIDTAPASQSSPSSPSSSSPSSSSSSSAAGSSFQRAQRIPSPAPKSAPEQQDWVMPVILGTAMAGLAGFFLFRRFFGGKQ